VKVATHINAPVASTAVDTLKYNDNGNLTQKQRIVNGQIVRTWNYTNKKKDENKNEFDDNSKLLKSTETSGDYTIYEYDSNGNLIKELQFREVK
jgi:YD repeat-containing protein